jgi:hypothetical protein
MSLDGRGLKLRDLDVLVGRENGSERLARSIQSLGQLDDARA